MLGNLHPIVQSSVLDQMETKPKLGFRYHEFLMDCALPELLEVIK
jgi:hypothetical protein